MSRARELAKLGNENVISVDANNQIGIGSVTPDRRFDVGTGDLIVGAAITLGSISGIVSATAFHGDGSNLEGVASAGLGTALGAVEGRGDDVIYYTNKVLNINDDVTLDPPTSTNTAYTQYAEIVVADSKDLIIASGDEFIPDILGLSTAGVSAMSGTGGRLRVGSITNKAGTGAPDLVNGVVVSGIATFTDNVSIAGTLTYNDVTNIDSVGIVTAQSGIRIGTGGTVGPASTGIVTYFGDGSNLSGVGVAGVNTTGFSTFKDVSVQGITTFSNLTDSSSTTTGALVISGGVGIAKSMYIGGNIAFADGKGIDFSASADGSGATVSSEVLDDYEEGLWTGTIKYDTNTPSTDSNVCQYVKVGNLCHAQGRISVTNDPGGNALTCTGLPFAASNPTGDGNSACGSVYMEATSANVDYGWVVTFVPDGDTTIYFRQSGMTDAGNDVADHADSGTNYMFSVVYRTA